MINCFIWEKGCQTDWSSLAAWIQAFASVGAIWWAGKFASSQATKQYENSLQLIRVEDRQRAIAILTTIKTLIAAVASSGDELRSRLESDPNDKDAIKEAAETLLSDISAEAEKLNDIPIFELPTAALEAVLILQRLGRQRRRHVEKFAEQNFFTEIDDNKFLIDELRSLSEIQKQLCLNIEIAISRVVEDKL